MLQRSFFISVFRRRPGCFSPAENLGDLRFFHPLPLYADEAENTFFNVQFDQIPFFHQSDGAAFRGFRRNMPHCRALGRAGKASVRQQAMVEARSGSEAMASVV